MDLCDALQVVQDGGYEIVRHAVETLDASGRQVLDPTELCRHRYLAEEESALEDETPWEIIINGLAALLCVSVAALAAGLTLGLLGLDPLMLLIKERASEDERERASARKLLPVISQHHRLLVTLLLMNAVANEALPIFLEALVPPAFAILVSVTLVLFGGEIIPSAIFTGPQQINIAVWLLPLVRFVMWVLYPIAGPIAKLLDYLLHSDEGEHGTASYTRSELAALIRIQYEERLTNKKKRKSQNQILGDHIGGLDFTPAITNRNKSLRALKHQKLHELEALYKLDSGPVSNKVDIHQDEVTMVEGALQMNTKVAMDVFTPHRKVFSIPFDMELNERNMVKIYASGFTRVPVHEPGDKTAIVGILMTRSLIVVNPQLGRPVSTLPLRSPRCVSPAAPLVHVLNMMQSGGAGAKGGHLALVCARPSVGERAFLQKESLPGTAGLMGIITLEDVLEMLLQEQIYDEMDRKERTAHRLAIMVVNQWKKFVQRKKSGTTSLSEVVEAAVEAAETTALLHEKKHGYNV